MSIRGIRGAVVAGEDRPGEILSSTRELIKEIIRANPTFDAENVASVIFTTTPDLTSAYPAQAARQIGWTDVPLLCCLEIPVPDGLKRCIRVLIHWNTDLPQDQVNSVYLGQAASLRPHQTQKNLKRIKST